MATAKTPTKITLPAPRSVNAPRRQRGSKTANFAAWKSAIDSARQAAGYDKTSEIYGKTDTEVLTSIRIAIESYAQDNHGTMHADIAKAKKLVLELIKRKTAREIAGKTYRGK